MFHCISPGEVRHQGPSAGKANVMRLVFIVLSLVFAQEIGAAVFSRRGTAGA
jgi:hypothetical protein